MDYEKEAEKLSNGTEFLKLEAGQHKVTFLDDGEEKIVPDTFSDKDNATMVKIFFKVKLKDKEYTWSVVKGETETSLYGQLILVGRNFGTLVNKTLNVIVQGEGKKKKYIVMESVGLSKNIRVPEEKLN